MENTQTSPASRTVIFIGILGAVNCILLVVNLGLVANIHQRQSEGTAQDQNTFTVTKAGLLGLLPLNERFPGYFRSQEEEKEGWLAVRTLTPVNRTANISDLFEDTCDVSFPDGIPFVPLNKAMAVNHGCCKSNFSIYSPTSLVDIYGVNRTFAQFNGYRQYFPKETCETVNDKYKCKCITNDMLVSGVYAITAGYNVTLFRIPGCCHCVNGVTCSEG